MTTRDDAIALARKLQRLIDHPGTGDHERNTATTRLNYIMEKHGLTVDDIVESEQLEPDLPADATYDQIWASILDQVGIKQVDFDRQVGQTVADRLEGIPFVGELLKEKADPEKLGSAISSTIISVLKKGLEK